jgi:hypothetical protein
MRSFTRDNGKGQSLELRTSLKEIMPSTCSVSPTFYTHLRDHGSAEVEIAVGGSEIAVPPKIYANDPTIWLHKGVPFIVPITTLEQELSRGKARKDPNPIFHEGNEVASSFADFVEDWVKASGPDTASQVSKKYEDSNGTVATIKLSWAGTAEGSRASQPGSTQGASSS